MQDSQSSRPSDTVDNQNIRKANLKTKRFMCIELSGLASSYSWISQKENNNIGMTKKTCLC